MDEFDKARMQQYIDNNIALFSDYSRLCPTMNLQKNELFGYVDLKPLNDKVAILCTMVCGYDRVKHEYCPNYGYIFKTGRTLQLLQQDKKKLCPPPSNTTTPPSATHTTRTGS